MHARRKDSHDVPLSARKQKTRQTSTTRERSRSLLIPEPLPLWPYIAPAPTGAHDIPTFLTPHPCPWISIMVAQPNSGHVSWGEGTASYTLSIHHPRCCLYMWSEGSRRGDSVAASPEKRAEEKEVQVMTTEHVAGKRQLRWQNFIGDAILVRFQGDMSAYAHVSHSHTHRHSCAHVYMLSHSYIFTYTHTHNHSRSHSYTQS